MASAMSPVGNSKNQFISATRERTAHMGVNSRRRKQMRRVFWVWATAILMSSIILNTHTKRRSAARSLTHTISA